MGRAASALGALLVCLYSAVAVLQIQVLNPLAKMPGMSIAEIHRAVHTAGQSMAVVPMLLALAPGPLIALALAALAATGRISTRTSAASILGLLAAGSPIYGVASFGAGMSLADTFMTSGHDASPWAAPLHLVSGASVLVLAAMGTRALLRSIRSTRTPPTTTVRT